MKRLINVIEQDAAIWELSKQEVELILCKGVYNKIDEMQTFGLSENDMIDAWVDAFNELMPSFDAIITPYEGVDRTKEYFWMKERPKSWWS